MALSVDKDGNVATVDGIFQGSQVTPQTFVGSSEGFDASSEGLSKSTELSQGKSTIHLPPRDSFGRLIIDGLNMPFIDDLNELHNDFREKLIQIAREAREVRKLSKHTMQELILELCHARL